jgi:hypothetical protein
MEKFIMQYKIKPKLSEVWNLLTTIDHEKDRNLPVVMALVLAIMIGIIYYLHLYRDFLFYNSVLAMLGWLILWNTRETLKPRFTSKFAQSIAVKTYFFVLLALGITGWCFFSFILGNRLYVDLRIWWAGCALMFTFIGLIVIWHLIHITIKLFRHNNQHVINTDDTNPKSKLEEVWDLTWQLDGMEGTLSPFMMMILLVGVVTLVLYLSLYCEPFFYLSVLAIIGWRFLWDTRGKFKILFSSERAKNIADICFSTMFGILGMGVLFFFTYLLSRKLGTHLYQDVYAALALMFGSIIMIWDIVQKSIKLARTR